MRAEPVLGWRGAFKANTCVVRWFAFPMERCRGLRVLEYVLGGTWLCVAYGAAGLANGRDELRVVSACISLRCPAVAARFLSLSSLSSLEVKLHTCLSLSVCTTRRRGPVFLRRAPRERVLKD